jgi:hypothetical protein
VTAAEFLKAVVDQATEAPQFDELAPDEQREVLAFAEMIEFLVGGHEIPQEFFQA